MKWLNNPYSVTVEELTEARSKARDSYLVRAALDAAVQGKASEATKWARQYIIEGDK
jgi:hypothetical protein